MQIPGVWHAEWAAFFYQPVFLLICLPLALLPFSLSALTWAVTTWGLLLASIRPLIPRAQGAVLIAVANPAAWLCALGGQNGLLTAGLFTFGVRWLDERPILAGCLLGGLTYKPQFGAVVPFALLASRRWRVMVSAALTSGGLIIASLLAFGSASWQAFFRILPLTRIALETGAEKPVNLLSVMGSLVFLGVPIRAAETAQGCVTLICCGAALIVAWRQPKPAALGSAMCVCACVASPWLHYYDLTILALPVAWIISEGLRGGFWPWEKVTCLVIYAWPLVGAPLAIGLHLPLAIPALTLLFALIWRRAAVTSSNSHPH